MAMNTPRRRLSPARFAEETGLGVRHASYHFAELADAGCIVLVDTRARRGATEHIYEPLQAALAWTAEWKQLNPRLKRGVLSSVLGGAIEALGSAIDSGTFEARDSSHLSWNTVEMNQQAWNEMSEVLDRALEDLLVVQKRSAKRIAGGASGFLASYFLASFESPGTFDPMDDVPLTGAESGGSPRKTLDKQRIKRRKRREGQSESQIMAKIMSHPIRVRILMAMNTPRRRLSPKLFAEETGLALQDVSYHFGELEDTGCIALVGTKRRRGAREHVYEPMKTAIQWTDEWRNLGPAIKQTVLASVMRGAVEALGAAIDDGTFESRDESHFSWSTIQVDDAGWNQVAEILDRALEELMEIDRKSLQGQALEGDTFAGSYFLASFESPKTISTLIP